MELQYSIGEALGTDYFGLREQGRGRGDRVRGRQATGGDRQEGVDGRHYDNFYLPPVLTDDYVAVVRGLTERYYASVTRYTTSAFMRLKLSDHLSERGLAPHDYESRQEALSWLG